MLLVLIGGIIVMGHETLQTSYSAKDIAPRLVTGFLAANLSLVLISRAITLANGLSAALAGHGVTPATAAAALLGTLTAPLSAGGSSWSCSPWPAAVLALVLAVVYVLRLMALVLLTAAAPLALACYALPQTAWAARWWWRALTACLAIQVRPGAGADRGGAGVLLRRVAAPARHQQRQRAAGADRAVPAVHHDADPVVDQPPRAVLLRPQPDPPRRPVRLLRRRPVPRQPAAARRSRGPGARARRGRPGPRACRAARRAGPRGGGPRRARGTARRQAGTGAGTGTGPGRGQARRRRTAAARRRARTRRGPGGPGGAIAGPGREPAARPPARPGSRRAGPARSSEPGRPRRPGRPRPAGRRRCQARRRALARPGPASPACRLPG